LYFGSDVFLPKKVLRSKITRFFPYLAPLNSKVIADLLTTSPHATGGASFVSIEATPLLPMGGQDRFCGEDWVGKSSWGKEIHFFACGLSKN
jgi:hypothetical protein